MGVCKQKLLSPILALLITACLTSAVWAGDMVLVVNQGISANSLSKGDVKSIYLAKKKSIDGTSVRLATLKDEDLAGQFLKKYVGKTPSQFSAYYKKLIFTGKGKPPKKMKSEAEMVAYVARTTGAIGYVSKGAVTDAVKTINVTN